MYVVSGYFTNSSCVIFIKIRKAKDNYAKYKLD